jgi:hypothetical protein
MILTFKTMSPGEVTLIAEEIEAVHQNIGSKYFHDEVMLCMKSGKKFYIKDSTYESILAILKKHLPVSWGTG